MGILKKDGKGKLQKCKVTFKLEQDKEIGDVYARENADMVPDRESREAGKAEVKKDAADRAQKLWACISKTTVSASALTFVAKRRTTADVSRIPVRSASPCVKPNTPRISHTAPPSPTRSVPAGTRLPAITNLSENSKMLFQQGVREQAPLVLIDLEDETDTQERNAENDFEVWSNVGSSWVEASCSRITVKAASPCGDQLPNTPMISHTAPLSPARSAPGWNARTRLPAITNLSENAKMLFQQGVREQAPLVLIDLEDETDTQERNAEVMEVQTASRKYIMKRTASGDESRIKKGLVSAAGLAVSSLPLEPVSRGAAREASPQDKVKYTRPATSRVYDLVFRDLQEIPHPSNRPHNSWQRKCDKRKKTKSLHKRDVSVQTLVTALKNELEGVEESGKRKEAEEETERRGGEEKKDSEVHGKEPGKKWWRRLMCLLPCFCALAKSNSDTLE